MTKPPVEQTPVKHVAVEQALAAQVAVDLDAPATVTSDPDTHSGSEHSIAVDAAPEPHPQNGWPTVPPSSGAGPIFRNWPSPATKLPGAALLTVVLTGGFAALTWLSEPGLNGSVVMLACIALAAALGRGSFRRFQWLCLILAVPLASMMALRTDATAVVLSTLTAAVLVGAAVTNARRWLPLVITPFIVAIAAIRALPWVGATLSGRSSGRGWGSWIAGVFGAVVVALVFGSLLSSADPLFGSLLDQILPDIDTDSVGPRVAIFVFVVLAMCGGCFAALSAPGWDHELRSEVGFARPRTDWVLPLGTAMALLASFVVVQLVGLFGGHEVVLEGTGITYAERARTGFGQLVAVTALTLLLVGAARLMARSSDRRLLLGLTVALSVAAMVIVASAVWRLWLYVDAYGLTTARIFGAAIEIWLALLIVASTIVTYTRGRWLAEFALLSGAFVLAITAAIGPDARVATYNVARYCDGREIDVDYLYQLSDDAVPALDRLPEPMRGAVLDSREQPDRPWYAWNFAANRAQNYLDPAHFSSPLPDCQPAPTNQF